MRDLFANNCLDIAPGRAVSGIAGQGDMLRVASGRVWLTVEGDAHDYWLDAGDTFAVAPGRLIVIEAGQHSSRIALIHGRQRVPAFGLGAQLRHLARRVIAGKSTAAASPSPCGALEPGLCG